MFINLKLLGIASVSVAAAAKLPLPAQREIDFTRDVQPLFQKHCIECHGAEKQDGGYRLDNKRIAFEGGDSHAPNIVHGKSAESPLIQFVAGMDEEMRMPSEGKPLTVEEIAVLRGWIDQGAEWPDSASTKVEAAGDWWSLRPLAPVAVPTVAGAVHPVDAFVRVRLAQEGLAPSPEADRRTLVRRAYFDLHGLPPSPEEVDAFVRDTDPRAWDILVNRLLDSPRYGERWARHWLDVAHYGDTHGYDKDQPRPHAWPYRDYVIRAFNEDRPYASFVQEQIAGDVLFPGSRDGIEALGFLAAGPWDMIGHSELAESKIDGKIARHLDRDDMVASTIGTFASLTVHCAQCHDHKFDPITAEDYYSLQAVFAAIDRTDRSYDADPVVASRRKELAARKSALDGELAAALAVAEERAGLPIKELDVKLAALQQEREGQAAAFGWHGEISLEQDSVQWVQVDLGGEQPLGKVWFHPSRDDFNGIYDGFGFPVRFRVEASADAEFRRDVALLLDHTAADFPNPGIRPVVVEGKGSSARYLRITAVRLAPRQNDYNFALSEVRVFDSSERLLTATEVTSLNSVEVPPRWSRANLIDGYYPGKSEEIGALKRQREELLREVSGDEGMARWERLKREGAAVEAEIRALPEMKKAYVGSVHHGAGNFIGTGPAGGKPRTIRLLSRGDVTRPVREVGSGAIPAVAHAQGRFELSAEATEGERRAALANWLADPANPLTWRSIVNRVWQYHFGRAIADSPNDFGRMGQPPSHPELLDWLALEFRAGGGSIKSLHRTIMTSETYRQRSDTPAGAAASTDSENVLLWRMNRRKLEAEVMRDSLIAVAGKLDLTMGGPGFQDFVIERPEHSPHYQYHLADADNPAFHRRAIYRFIVRSKPQPWLTTLDCADPSMAVDKRNTSVSPLQALVQMNNQLVLVMSRHFAGRLDQAGASLEERINLAYRIVFQREAGAEERAALAAHAERHGLVSACRVILNLNEFNFAD